MDAGTVGAQLIPQPSETTLEIFGVLIGSLLVGTAVVTLGRSIERRRADRRRRAVERSIKWGLYERLDEPDPGWEAWIETLSSIERTVLEDAIERQLQLVVGADRNRLTDAAEALGIEKRARRSLSSEDRHTRLRGLQLLGSLECPVEPTRLEASLEGTRAEREAAVRLLVIENSAAARRRGVEALFASEAAPLSVYGIDGAYELLRSDPDPLLRWLDRTTADDPARLLGALSVLSRLDPTATDASLEGVIEYLDHDDPNVRAAARTALSEYGWRSDIRTEIREGFETDPSPTVRIAAYRTLACWNDDSATRRLLAALPEETNPRCRLAIATALRDDPGSPIEAAVEERILVWTDVELLADENLV